MRALIQHLLDRAESFCSRRRCVWLTFQIIALKRRLGLNFWR